MKYNYVNSTKKLSIQSATVFCDALGSDSPLDVKDFGEFLKRCEALVADERLSHGDPAATSSALGNARGRWYEWLFSIGCFQFLNRAGRAYENLLIPLPNKDKFDYLSLYEKQIYAFIEDLRTKTLAHNVTLVSSNPDFVIAKNLGQNAPIDATTVNLALLAEIDGLYENFVHSLRFDDFVGFVSVKTSVRGDRRLQLPMEGALVKSYYEHLKARMWQVDAQGITYYAATMAFTKKDLEALQTVATHSILSVNTKPEKSVNEVYKISSGDELSSFLNFIL
ncbi:MAG: hypothetical protein GQ535_09465 [Rhodobacteraceae bacterium]|nr:hypothetical protein [Paracoccaceae bacterium]